MRVSLRSPYDAEIVRLALPAFGALVAEPLFLLGDAAIVGRLGTEPLAGLGVAGTALATLVSVCVFLAYGTTAAVARRLGAGDLAGALHAGVDGLWLAVALAAALVVVGLPAAPTLVDALGASAAVAPYAITYLRIALLGVPAMLLVLAGTGLLRGLQDTRTPLVVAVAVSLLNLALNVLLVLGLGWGIAGSAWGTTVTQYAAATAYLVVVGRGVRAHGVALRPDPLGVRAAATAGAHLVVRTLSLRAVLLLATAVAARLGDPEVAAHQVVFGVWSLLALALDAVAIAGQAIIGRTLGAGDVPATRAVSGRMLQWGVVGVVGGVALGAAVLAVHAVLPGLFTADPRVRTLIAAALVVVAALQPVAGVVFVLDGVLIGAGEGPYLAAAGVGTLLVFAPAAALVLVFDAGLVGLWLALGMFMLTRLVLLSTRVHGDRWVVTGALR
jgi:putative MATE family efflux protein